MEKWHRNPGSGVNAGGTAAKRNGNDFGVGDVLTNNVCLQREMSSPSRPEQDGLNKEQRIKVK